MEDILIGLGLALLLLSGCVLVALAIRAKLRGEIFVEARA